MRKVISFFASLYSFFLNYIIACVPCFILRRFFFKLGGMKIGKKTILNMKQYILSQQRIKIGDFCHINKGTLLDGRGGLIIGNNVSISFDCKLLTGTHDPQSNFFDLIYKPIKIEDNVWLGPNVIVLPGVTIHKGAVIGAGAVVTKDIEENTINVGIPAKKMKDRKSSLEYKCEWTKPFF